MGVSAANLKWYHSGGSSNSDPNASLGGAISSHEVGTSLNGLFDDVSSAEASAGDTEYRCIYFKNTDAGTLSNAVAWIDANTPGDDGLTIGLDLAGKTATADTIADESTAPDPAVTFSAAASKGAGLSLGNLAQNDYYAIWIKRVVPSSCASYASDTFTLKVEGDTA